MKYHLALVVFFLVFHLCLTSQFPEDLDIFKHLGVQTPYRFKSNKNDAEIDYPGCTPKKIWMILRHGTRFPKPKVVNAMNTQLQDLKNEILLQHRLGKGSLSQDILQNLEGWSVRTTNQDEDMPLTLEGEDEMVKLAKRMKKRFPAIFKNKYNNQTYKFGTSAKRRTLQSATSFVKGLFSKKNGKDVSLAPLEKMHTILRFYKHCDRWLKQVKKNPDTYKEHRAFGVSQQMNETLESMSNKLGLAKPLTLGQLKLMYKTCGFETAWNKRYLSPWCEIFDEKSAEVLEYYSDLKYYWMDGYGVELSYRQACLPIRNLFENLSHDKNPKAVLYFAHSGTILKIISHLGLYKPQEHLRGDEIHKDRAWRTSDIDCFASNFAFVKYSCKDGDYVLTLHQEHPVKLPPCKSELCSLQILTEYYHDSINNCDFDNMCSITKKDEF